MNNRTRGWLWRIAVRVSQAIMTAWALVLIVFLIQAAQGQQRVINAITAFFGVHTIYVDTNGSNATAVRGASWLPFKTLTAAKTTAASGDTIIVFPGTYTENDLLKNGVNWHFYNGANDTYTETNTVGAGKGIFDDRGLGAVASTISGSGNFTYIVTGTGSGNELGLFVVTNASSNIRFNAKDVSVNFANTMTWTSPAAFLVVNCAYVNIDMDRLLDLNQASSLAIAVWWMYGETYFHARQINYFGQWGVWSSESFLTAVGFNPNITQPIIPLAAFNLWASWDDNASPNYVQMESVNMATWFDFKRVSTAGNVGFEIDCVGGKTYIRGEKVQAPTCISMGLGAVNVADSQAWIDVQKMASTSASWFALTAGSMTANIGQLEDLGMGVSAAGIQCASSLGDFRINCPKLTMKASSTAKPVNFTTAGSKLRLHANIDATASNQPAVTVAAAGVILDECVLVTSAAVNCVSAAAAKTIVNYGSHANNAKSANVTVQVDAIIVDANVQ